MLYNDSETSTETLTGIKNGLLDILENYPCMDCDTTAYLENLAQHVHAEIFYREMWENHGLCRTAVNVPLLRQPDLTGFKCVHTAKFAFDNNGRDEVGAIWRGEVDGKTKQYQQVIMRGNEVVNDWFDPN